MKTYRVSILGCGGRGSAAARAYHQHPRTQVVGLCDLVPELLTRLGGELGVAARYDDYHRMIEATEPDIVVIPTGTEFHHELSLGVLGHGVHVDVEKPLCQTLQEADEVVDLAAARGLRVAVHHQGRTGGAMRSLVAAVKQGRIGELRYLLGSGKGYYAGYGLMNIGTHMLNNMLGVAGHCRSVSAVALTDGRPVTPEDVVPAAGGMGYVVGECLTANLQFAGNVTGTLLQHRFHTMDSAAYCLEVYGSEGRLFWRTGGAWYLPTPHDVPGDEACRWQPLDMIIPDSYSESSSAAEADYGYADDFVRALDEGREHECSGVEGRHVLEIIMGIFEAGARGSRVDLPQRDRTHPLLRWRAEAGLGTPHPVPRPYGEWLQAEDRRLGRG